MVDVIEVIDTVETNEANNLCFNQEYRRTSISWE